MFRTLTDLVKTVFVIFILSSFPIIAQSAPTANAATQITQTSFTANWTPTTAVPAYYLMLATDAGFTNIVGGYNNFNVGNGTSYTVTGGLTANTVYYYKIGVSAMVAPYVYSNIISFRTGPQNPVAVSATGITQTRANANWNSVSNASSYEITIAANSGFISGVVYTISDALSYPFSGLTPGTQYWYRLRAYNSDTGVSGYSNVITFTTFPDLPAAPVAAAASSISQNVFTANWNTVSTADGYFIDVSTNTDFTSLVIGYGGQDVGNVTSLSVTGLTANTRYFYRIRAYNAGGTSGNSNSIGVTTLPNVPSVPIALAATNITQTGFSASWNAAAGATGYYLDVSTDISFSNIPGSYNNLNVGNVLTFSVTGLTPNTSYYYRVRAFNTGGTSSNSNIISVITLINIPAVPVAAAAGILSNSSFSAKWYASTGAAGYFLDVALDAGFTVFLTGYNNKDVGNITTFTLTGVNYNTNYYYRLRAYNAGGTSENSNVINVFILVGIENEALPADYCLYQNYPNPFNPSTMIKFSLKKNSPVKIILYDILGKEIETLAKGEFQRGVNTIRFVASNLSNGIYIYRIITEEFSDMKKMVLLK